MEHPDRTKQFDVPYVDGALLSILVPRVHGYLRDCSVHIPILHQLPAAVSSLIPSVLLDDADINGLIQLSLSAVMAFITIGRGVGTPAMNALGLRIKQHQQQHPAHANTRDTRIDRLRLVAAYVVLSGLLPTVYRMARKRWEDDRDERMNGDDVSYEMQDQLSTGASRVEMLARHRRRRLRDGVMKFVAFVVPPVRLVNHLCFVLGGSSTGSSNSGNTGSSSSIIPPTLPMRIAGLSYATETSGYQHINYAYAYRRVLYEQMFAIAQIMAPSARQLAALPGSVASVATRLRQKAEVYVQHMLKGGDSINNVSGDGQRSDAAEDRGSRRACSICQAYPITMPYASSCGRDVYCYYCIRFALLDKEDHHRSRTYRRSR